MNPKRKIITTGIRPGEKLHEEMITKSDSVNAYDIGKFYLILPTNEKSLISKFKKKFSSLKKVKEDFSYNSKDNTEFLNVDNLRKIINEK